LVINVVGKCSKGRWRRGGELLTPSPIPIFKNIMWGLGGALANNEFSFFCYLTGGYEELLPTIVFFSFVI
jgi:hypothetical protein